MSNGNRWKMLQYTSRLKTEDNLGSRSHSRRYTPNKCENQSQLSKNFKMRDESKLNETFNNSKIMRKEGSNNGSILVASGRLPKETMSYKEDGEEEVSSPTLNRQLKKIIQQSQPESKRIYFEYDKHEEKNNYQKQIAKIQKQFNAFKRLILNQLAHQQKIVEELANQILLKMNQTVERGKIQRIPTNDKNSFVWIQDDSLQGTAKIGKLDQLTKNLAQSRTEMKHSEFPVHREMYLSNITSIENKSRSKASTSREHSKREFTKLFQAVNCLKNDLKSLGTMKKQGNKTFESQIKRSDIVPSTTKNIPRVPHLHLDHDLEH